MGLQDIIKRIYHSFFAVWSLTSLAVCIMALIFGWATIHVPLFFALFFLAFLTSLTYIVFYSKKELSIGQLAARMVVQFILVMGIALTLGYFVGWVTRTRPVYTVVTVISVVVIFAAVTTFESFQTWRLADKLNHKLQERSIDKS